ncbi:MAG: hypothetical protein ICV67_06545 [Thermoleophilia bacterium]|nr:hypothetical protein [Thermoleophilia bacterium]
MPPAVALAAIVAVAAVFRLALGAGHHLPTVLGDELVYSGLAKGWALHGRPLLRGSVEGGYSTLYPLFLAPAFGLAADGARGLAAAKALNAVAMASAAVPAYLLARRAVPPGWSLGVALLSVAVPWTAYSALTLTESLFYPVFLAYAVVLAVTLQRGSWPEQAALLATLAVLVGIRTQGLAAGVGTVGAIVLYGALTGELARTLRRFAPTLTALSAVAAVGVGARAAGVALPTSTYDPLFGSLGRVGGMLEWGAWSLGSFELALGVVPLVAFPVAAWGMLRAGGNAGARSAAAVSVSLGAAVLGSVALLSASPFGLDRLHERSLFFVTPLVLVCFAHWLWNGLERPRALSLACALGAVALAALLPRELVFESFDVDVPSALFFRELEAQVPGVPFRVWTIGIAAVGAGTFLLARRPFFPVLAVALAFAGVTARVDFEDSLTSAQARSLSWVDHALPAGGEVTLVNLGLAYSTEPCASAAWHEQRRLVVWTEYLNARIDAVAWLYEPNGFDGLPARQLAVGTGGLVLSDGRPFAPRYVVIDTRQSVTGVRVARFDLTSIRHPELGNGASLTLWRVDPPLRLYPLPEPVPPRGDRLGC